MWVFLLSAAATRVSMFKAEPNPVVCECCLSMPKEMSLINKPDAEKW